MNVVGLTGYAGSGKSTVANYLVEGHGYTRLSFAGPLKKMLRTLDPIIGEQYGEAVRLSEVLAVYAGDENGVKQTPVWGDEYRRLLQVLGTDCIRAVDPDFWVKAAVAQMTDEDGLYVFDDVRFPNEAQVIKDLNKWGLWNVQRSGYEAVNGHTSEQWAGKMDEWQVIYNTNSLEFLHSEVDRALRLAFSDTAAVV